MPDLPSLPPVADQSLSVALLAHNDAAHLEAVLSDWITLLNGLDRNYDLLLVDDGSTDGTGELAEALAGRFRRLRVLRRTEPKGQGAALGAALAEARQPLLFYTTCNRQYQPSDLKKLLAEIDKVHLVVGYRRWQAVPGGLRWLGRFYRFFVWLLFGFTPERLPGWLGWRKHFYWFFIRVIFGVRLHDVGSVFRLLRRDIFTHLPIQSDGDFAHTELLAKANFLGCFMNDVPIAYRPCQEEEGKGRRRQMWRDVLRILSHPRFRKEPVATTF
jgi:glycosyltransferase involved in cell wall biosynthesis